MRAYFSEHRIETAVLALLAAAAIVLPSRQALSQTSSLYQKSIPGATAPTMQTTSWTGAIKQEPPSFHEHDHVTVLISQKLDYTTEGELDRKKKVSNRIGLTDWISFDGLSFIPDPMTQGQPALAAEMDNKFKAEGSQEITDELEATLTCEVIEILDTGHLRIEGQGETIVGEDVTIIWFAGIVDPEDVLPDGTILSEKVLYPQFRRVPKGSVYDGYRRGWFQRWLDRVQPF